MVFASILFDESLNQMRNYCEYIIVYNQSFEQNENEFLMSLGVWQFEYIFI